MKIAARLIAGLLLLNAIGLNAPLWAQQTKKDSDDPLRLKTNLVEVRAVVTDKLGNAIDNLTKDDFEVSEKGKPRSISFFSLENIGEPDKQPAGDRTAKPMDPGSASIRPARTIAFFVDTFNLSPTSLLYAKQSLRKFIDHQSSDRDTFWLLTSSGALGFLEQMTKDRQMLRFAIDRLGTQDSGPDPLFTPFIAARVAQGDPTAISLAIQILIERDHIDGPLNILERLAQSTALGILAEAAFRRRCVLGRLKAMSQRMAEMPGQRLVFFLSDGFSMMDVGGGVDTNEVQLAIGSAVRSGVVIYSLDTKGLAPPPGFDVTSVTLSTASAGGANLHSYLADSEHELQNGMNALAADTGGEAFFHSNELGVVMERSLRKNSMYYVLAFHAADFKDEKEFRRISVRVKNHPEYQVRAQRGYASPELTAESADKTASPQQRLIQSIAAPLPVTGIRVAASAAYFETGSDNSNVSFAAQIGADHVTFSEHEKRFAFALDVLTVVYDRSGKVVNTFSDKAHGDLMPERADLAKRTGFTYSKRLALKPGAYQIRVGIMDQASEKIGVSTGWVEVPDLKRGKMALSSIIIGDETSASVDEAEIARLSGLSLERGFKIYRRGSRLVYSLMAYNLSANHNHSEPVIQTEIFQDGTAVFNSGWSALDSRTLSKDEKRTEAAGQLNLALQPGAYELRITIKDPGSKQTAQKTIMFGVDG